MYQISNESGSLGHLPIGTYTTCTYMLPRYRYTFTCHSAFPLSPCFPQLEKKEYTRVFCSFCHFPPYMYSTLDMSLHDRILDLEEQTWRALQTDGSALIPYLTSDAIMQFPLGLKVTANSRPSVQDILHSSAFVPWRTFRLKNVDVTPVGADGAVISYRAIATRASVDPKDERDAEFDALCSSVWRKDGASFYMCFHQQTMTAEGL